MNQGEENPQPGSADLDLLMHFVHHAAVTEPFQSLAGQKRAQESFSSEFETPSKRPLSAGGVSWTLVGDNQGFQINVVPRLPNDSSLAPIQAISAPPVRDLSTPTSVMGNNSPSEDKAGAGPDQAAIPKLLIDAPLDPQENTTSPWFSELAASGALALTESPPHESGPSPREAMIDTAPGHLKSAFEIALRLQDPRYHAAAAAAANHCHGGGYDDWSPGATPPPVEPPPLETALEDKVPELSPGAGGAAMCARRFEDQAAAPGGGERGPDLRWAPVDHDVHYAHDREGGAQDAPSSDMSSDFDGVSLLHALAAKAHPTRLLPSSSKVPKVPRVRANRSLPCTLVAAASRFVPTVPSTLPVASAPDRPVSQGRDKQGRGPTQRAAQRAGRRGTSAAKRPAAGGRKSASDSKNWSHSLLGRRVLTASGGQGVVCEVMPKGWIAVKLEGPNGAKVKARPGEVVALDVDEEERDEIANFAAKTKAIAHKRSGVLGITAKVTKAKAASFAAASALAALRGN